jgi:hypothetical protein
MERKSAIYYCGFLFYGGLALDFWVWWDKRWDISQSAEVKG